MSGAEKKDIVHMRDVRFSWPGERNFIMNIDSFSVKHGERLLLLGPSGSGKSTLLSLLAGIVTPQRGRIRALDADINNLGAAARDRFRAEHFGIIFQMFNLLPYGAAMDNVLLPLSFAPKRRERSEQAGGARKEAGRLMTALGLGAELHTKPAAFLSVGQQQRVAAARALIGSPQIIIADEPTSALDPDRQSNFLDLLFSQVEQAGASLIMVSHDESLGKRFGRVAALGGIVRVEGAS